MDKPGNSLGSGSRGSGAVLTPEQLRERRIQALTKQNQQSTSDCKADPATVPPVSAAQGTDDLDEDAELQAALALSLQDLGKDESAPQSLAASLASEDDRRTSAETSPMFIPPTPETVLQQIWKTREPYDAAPFHEIMWDQAITTEEDKARWMAEAIRTLPVSSPQAEKVQPSTTMLSQLVQSETPLWGLLQTFGGPCGVLAAVQAEALKILIWGTAIKRTSNDCDMPPSQSNLDLDSPAAPSQLLSGVALTTHIVRVAIARAIAVLLTRAALQPAASDDDAMATSETKQCQTPVVRVVLPLHTTSDEPAGQGNGPASTLAGHSDRLCVFTINPRHEGLAKRQRTDNLPPTRLRSESLSLSDRESWAATVRAVGDFLLHSFDTATAPIDHFLTDGGLILLVMSLVVSRGKELIQSEFDDTSGSKLTAQFGHCSQELMNMLLTGQAVSNVFDNNLSPDKGIVCRGVQYQSDIGYLSQLESFRYCQVGSYYKTPSFPIWVIGSTSHFTVLFGNEDALREREGDRLLEQCRRAFKANMADDTGFIPSDNLAEVFRTLGLDSKVNGNEQAIAAAIEMPGAGVILWQDFWSATSRLMTGASVESIMSSSAPDGTKKVTFDEENGLHDLPDLIPITKMESDEEMARRIDSELNHYASSETSIVPHSSENEFGGDEEMARKLQAEWNAEADADGSGSRASDQADAGSPTDLTTDFDSTFPVPDPMATQIEGDGESLDLFHYNGLHGGKLRRFKVIRMHSDDAGGSHMPPLDVAGGGHGGLDDILRTKWPSCSIDWLDIPAPEID